MVTKLLFYIAKLEVSRMKGVNFRRIGSPKKIHCRRVQTNVSNMVKDIKEGYKGFVVRVRK
jgi:hypothetical protein